MRGLPFAIFLLFLLCVAVQGQSRKEVVKSTRVIRGTVVGFIGGDEVFADLKDSRGKSAPYYMKPDALAFYLAANVKRAGRFTVQKVTYFDEEAQGKITVDRIVEARFGTETFRAWWKVQLRNASEADLDKKWEPVVDGLIETK
jgi:hypothetical protein